MADVEKHHIQPVDNVHPNSNGAGTGPFPVGAGHTEYPYTLGASAAQQQYYQGGSTAFRKFANPAPL